MQRSRPASRSAAISNPRAAAAAAIAPRSARALPSARLSRSLRRRARLQPGPARPARPPRAPRGERLRAPPSCSGAGRRAEESQYIPAGSRGVARSLQVPGAATRRRLGLLTVERGGRRPRGGGRAPERAVPRTLTAAHARLPPHEHPLRAPRPAGLQSRRSLRGQPRRWSRAGAGAGGGPAPLPAPPSGSPEPGTGARAGRCCCCSWRQGNPGEAIRLLRLPPLAPNPRERFPLTSADGFKGYGDPRQSRTERPSCSRRPRACAYLPAPGLYIGPQRKPNGLREETWVRRGSAHGFMCSPKTIAGRRALGGGPGAVPVGGGRPHCADPWLPLGRYPTRWDPGALCPH